MRRLLLLLTVTFLSLPSFSQSVKFNTIKDPFTLPQNSGLPQQNGLAGDFNSDGREDFIVTSGSNGASPTFHIQLSTGTGTYTAGPSYTVPKLGNIIGYAAGDFNNDGKLDLALIAPSSSVFYVYLGEGNGVFHSPVTYNLGFVPNAIVAADVNHDGKMDLVLLNTSQDSNAASIVSYLGNGSGGFSAGPATDVNFEIYNLWTGDFDGDGHADVMSAICGTGGCDLIVFYGDGTGKFPASFSTATGQLIPTVADVDGDGKSDVISSNTGDSNAPDQTGLSVFYGASNRTLVAAQIPTTECTFGRPVSADFNGDHAPDVIFAEHTCGSSGPGDGTESAQLAFIAGAGNRAFGPEQVIFNSTQAQLPMIEAEVMRANNSDTKPDLIFSQVVQSTGRYDYTMMVNESTGKFAACNAPTTPTGFRICSPTSGATVTSPVKFSIGAAQQVPIRKVEVWVDGVKKYQSLYAFSRYGFLDTSLALAKGTHSITIDSAGWDNSTQSKKYSITVH